MAPFSSSFGQGTSSSALGLGYTDAKSYAGSMPEALFLTVKRGHSSGLDFGLEGALLYPNATSSIISRQWFHQDLLHKAVQEEPHAAVTS